MNFRMIEMFNVDMPRSSGVWDPEMCVSKVSGFMLRCNSEHNILFMLRCNSEHQRHGHSSCSSLKSAFWRTSSNAGEWSEVQFPCPPGEREGDQSSVDPLWSKIRLAFFRPPSPVLNKGTKGCLSGIGLVPYSTTLISNINTRLRVQRLQRINLTGWSNNERPRKTSFEIETGRTTTTARGGGGGQRKWRRRRRTSKCASCNSGARNGCSSLSQYRRCHLIAFTQWDSAANHRWNRVTVSEPVRASTQINRDTCCQPLSAEAVLACGTCATLDTMRFGYDSYKSW